MTADQILRLLSGVRSRGDRRWTALCPAHEDRVPVSQYARSTTGRWFIVGLDAALRTSALPSGSRWPTSSTIRAANRIRLSYVGGVRPMDLSAGGRTRSGDARRTLGRETRSFAK